MSRRLQQRINAPASQHTRDSGTVTTSGLALKYFFIKYAISIDQAYRYLSRIAPFCAGPLNAAELQPYSVQALPAQGGGELCGLPGIQGQGQRQTEGQRPGTGLSSSAT